MALTINNTDTGRIKVTGTTSASQVIHAAYVGLKFVYWYKPTTTGDLCTLKDENGNEIIQMNALVNNDSQMWPLFEYVQGIYCDDMDSGTLYLYLR